MNSAEKTDKSTNTAYANEEIHIGELIKAKIKEKGHTVTWFAKQIPCHRTNIYKIYKKSYLHPIQLSRISSILKYDFSVHYSEKNKNTTFL